MADTHDDNPLALATHLAIAWLANPNTRASAEEVSAFLLKISETFSGLVSPPEHDEVLPAEEYTPAVSVRKSLSSPEHIISMIDGKPYKTLRRHLAGHGLTPEQYRERYNLAPDYPMVSPSYSKKRRELARTIGLGRKPSTTSETATATEPTPASADAFAPKAAPVKRGRPRKSAPASAE